MPLFSCCSRSGYVGNVFGRDPKGSGFREYAVLCSIPHAENGADALGMRGCSLLTLLPRPWKFRDTDRSTRFARSALCSYSGIEAAVQHFITM